MLLRDERPDAALHITQIQYAAFKGHPMHVSGGGLWSLWSSSACVRARRPALFPADAGRRGGTGAYRVFARGRRRGTQRLAAARPRWRVSALPGPGHRFRSGPRVPVAPARAGCRRLHAGRRFRILCPLWLPEYGGTRLPGRAGSVCPGEMVWRCGPAGRTPCPCGLCRTGRIKSVRLARRTKCGWRDATRGVLAPQRQLRGTVFAVRQTRKRAILKDNPFELAWRPQGDLNPCYRRERQSVTQRLPMI